MVPDFGPFDSRRLSEGGLAGEIILFVELGWEFAGFLPLTTVAFRCSVGGSSNVRLCVLLSALTASAFVYAGSGPGIILIERTDEGGM